MKNVVVKTCLAAVVCLALVACGKSQPNEDYIGMKMNAKLIKNIVAEYQSLQGQADDINMPADKGELMALEYQSNREFHTRLYNKDGEMVTELDVHIDDVGPFVCGMARIDLNGTIAYINTKGEVVVPSGKYASGSSFWNDIATVQSEEGKWGVIRKDGSDLFPLEYEKAEIYPNGLIYLAREGEEQYEGAIFKADGTEVMSFQPMSVEAWRCILDYHEDYLLNNVIIVKTEADGFCSIYGDGSIENIGKFYDMGAFDEHKVAWIRAEDYSDICGIINADGKLIIPCEYLYARTTDYGIMMGNKGEKAGVFDFDGKVLWPFEYDNIGSFNRELACVMQGGQWKVIDHEGHSKAVAEGTPVYGKCYQMGTENGYGLATLTGEELLSPTHSWLDEISGTRLVLAYNDREYFNFDTGRPELRGYCQISEDLYNSHFLFDPDGYALFSSVENTDDKVLVDAKGDLLASGASRIGAFYVGDSNKVYYKGKEIAKVDGFFEQPKANCRSGFGFPFLDGIFVYSFDHKGKYTYFINKKGVVAKVDGYVDDDFFCHGLDVKSLFFAWMNPY